MITIKNDRLIVSINEKGAELQSIQCNGVEYLWQADAKFWAKHSPVLFPIVGELKGGFYNFNNKDYRLPRHGFARDKTFTAKQTSADSVIFTFISNADTLLMYPFEFVFQLGYSIKEDQLFCTYHVQNTNDTTMYFSVGGHPAFNVPLNSELSYEDYFLEFNADDVLNRYVLQDGLISDKTDPLPLNNKTLALTRDLFYKDAIVLKHISSDKIILRSNKDPHGVEFNFNHFPYFGIWAAKDAPFVCLEPWCGIADNIHHNNELITKEGINELMPDGKWGRMWNIRMF